MHNKLVFFKKKKKDTITINVCVYETNKASLIDKIL